MLDKVNVAATLRAMNIQAIGINEKGKEKTNKRVYYSYLEQFYPNLPTMGSLMEAKTSGHLIVLIYINEKFIQRGPDWTRSMLISTLVMGACWGVKVYNFLYWLH